MEIKSPVVEEIVICLLIHRKVEDTKEGKTAKGLNVLVQRR